MQFHRIVGFTAVAVGLPLAAACSHSSQPPPAAPPPAQAAAAESAEATPADECEQNAQPAQAAEPAPPATHAAKVKAARARYRHVLNCPMDEPGTTAAFISSSDGYPAIDFTTRTGNIDHLRRRVHAFMEPQVAAGSIEPGVSADTQGSGGNEMKPDVTYIGSKTRFVDLPRGIRVIYIPADDGQLEMVHGQVAAQVVRLDNGDCTGMHIHGVKMKDVYPPTSEP